MFQLTVGRKNKNNLKFNCRAKILCAFADDVPQARRNYFSELILVRFSRVGIGETSRFGQCLRERAALLRVLCRRLCIQRSQTHQRQEQNCSYTQAQILVSEWVHSCFLTFKSTSTLGMKLLLNYLARMRSVGRPATVSHHAVAW